MVNPIISYSETKYKKVSGSTTDSTDGKTVTNGQKITVWKFRANGADNGSNPHAYVRLVWDHGGAAETIISSTKGDIEVLFDTTNLDNQFTGDGTKKMSIIIENNNTSESPVIGGAFELVNI